MRCCNFNLMCNGARCADRVCVCGSHGKVMNGLVMDDGRLVLGRSLVLKIGGVLMRTTCVYGVRTWDTGFGARQTAKVRFGLLMMDGYGSGNIQS
jgi:hypothetical protein